MLQPTYGVTGTALLSDEDLRFLRDDDNLTNDERIHLLRRRKRDLTSHYAELVIMAACCAGSFVLSIVLIRMITPADSIVDLGLTVAFMSTIFGLMLFRIARLLRLVQHEHRIRKAKLADADRRAVPLSDPTMQVLINAFGSDWENARGLMLNHFGPLRSSRCTTVNCIVENYFDAVDHLKRQRDAGDVNEDKYPDELFSLARLAHSRYLAYWEEWSERDRMS